LGDVLAPNGVLGYSRDQEQRVVCFLSGGREKARESEQKIMPRNVASKAMWVGRTTTALTGLAVALALVLGVAAAMAVSAIQPQEANAASTVSVRTCDGGTILLTTPESRSLNMHNQARSARGLPGLCVHRLLTKAARSHSQEMINKDY
jgi:uncharacterized protein YkwD